MSPLTHLRQRSYDRSRMPPMKDVKFDFCEVVVYCIHSVAYFLRYDRNASLCCESRTEAGWSHNNGGLRHLPKRIFGSDGRQRGQTTAYSSTTTISTALLIFADLREASSQIFTIALPDPSHYTNIFCGTGRGFMLRTTTTIAYKRQLPKVPSCRVRPTIPHMPMHPNHLAVVKPTLALHVWLREYPSRCR